MYLPVIANVFLVFFHNSSDIFDMQEHFQHEKPTDSSNPTLLMHRISQVALASGHECDLSQSDSPLTDPGIIFLL